jgi:hypothetical protein
MSEYDAIFDSVAKGGKPPANEYDAIFQNVASGLQPSQAAQKIATTETNKSLGWGDVPMQAVQNAPQSASRFIGGLVNAVTSPIETAGNVGDLLAGGIRKVTPSVISNIFDRASPADIARQSNTANAFGGMMKDRYGTIEGVKNTIATDPVGALADLSTVLTGGAAATSKLPMVSNALQKGASLTNPLSVVAPVVRGVGRMIETPASAVLGVSTGVGQDTIRNAAKAGFNKDASFMDNISGKSGMADVLDTVQTNLQNMGAKKAADYRSGMVDIKGDKSVLSFSGVDKALKDAQDVVSYKGQVTNTKAAGLLDNINTEVQGWKNLNAKEYHTPEGLDKLKQKIGGMVDSIPFEEKTARMVGNNIYNSIKKEISSQAPTYSKVMSDYSAATEQIRDIERALSQNKGANVDTSLRKLQSLTRNNVNTNYGNRLDMAKALEEQGGNSFLPALSGQAMNSWAPRGLVGQGAMGAGGAGGLATAAINPAIAAGLIGSMALTSPRLIGTGLYGAGRGARLASDMVTAPMKAMGLNTRNAPTYGLLSSQSGNLLGE